MNLSSQLHHTASMLGDKPAYFFMDKASTYAELDASVTKFASGLEKLGVKKGDHIALLLGNSPHFVISMYGALRLGATVIPINPIYTADEIGYILNNGDVKVVVGGSNAAARRKNASASAKGRTLRHCRDRPKPDV